MTSIVVLGGKESGVGAALLAQQRGYNVFVSEKASIPEGYQKELKEAHIQWEEGQHSMDKILQADAIIKSPGIPNNVPVMKKVNDYGITVYSDIEWAARHSKATLIGITGSNGKSTCTALTYDVLKRGGLNVGIGGNIGNSWAREIVRDPKDYYVVEISSFQLEHIDQLHAHVAVLLNITPDHLDRYENFQHYIDTKFKITHHQSPNDYFLYCADDSVIQDHKEQYASKSQSIPFSIKKNYTRSTPLRIDSGWSRTAPYLLTSDKKHSQ